MSGEGKAKRIGVEVANGKAPLASVYRPNSQNNSENFVRGAAGNLSIETMSAYSTLDTRESYSMLG